MYDHNRFPLYYIVFLNICKIYKKYFFDIFLKYILKYYLYFLIIFRYLKKIYFVILF